MLASDSVVIDVMCRSTLKRVPTLSRLQDYSAYAAYNDEGEPPNTANPPPPVNVLDVVAQVI